MGTEEVEAVEHEGAVRFAELCSAANVPHIALLSSAWADPSYRALQRLPFARAQGQAIAAYSALESFERVSIFMPGAMLDEDGELMRREGTTPLLAGMMWRAIPFWNQMLAR